MARGRRAGYRPWLIWLHLHWLLEATVIAGLWQLAFPDKLHPQLLRWGLLGIVFTFPLASYVFRRRWLGTFDALSIAATLHVTLRWAPKAWRHSACTAIPSLLVRERTAHGRMRLHGLLARGPEAPSPTLWSGRPAPKERLHTDTEHGPTGHPYVTAIIVLAIIAAIRSITIPGTKVIDITWAGTLAVWLFAFTVMRHILETALPCALALRAGAIPMLVDILEETLKHVEAQVVDRVDGMLVDGLAHALGRDGARQLLFED